MNYYQVLFKGPLKQEEEEQLRAHAIDNFRCEGIELWSMDEKSVDDFLGKRAYSGGDLPESVIDEVDEGVAAEGQRCIAFFFLEEDQDVARDFSKWLEVSFKSSTITIEQAPAEDWNKKWKEFFVPLKITNDQTVYPVWESDKAISKKDIIINPGMGFGTGHHETTQLCLKAFDKIQDIPQENFLDFGCGSGILGIAFLQRFPNGRGDLVDIDPRALDNCLDNLQLNFKERDLTGSSLIVRERYKRKKNYGVVFANILEHVLFAEKKELIDAVTPGGYLIISGLLSDQLPLFKEKFFEGDKSFEWCMEDTQGDWGLLVAKRA